MKEFIITKKLAKHGKQSIFVIPSYLQTVLKPKTVVEVKIKALEVEQYES